jgi:hypothetical protein
MRDVRQLSRLALENLAFQLVDRLFLDIDPPGCPAELRGREVYNPDKEWDLDSLDFIADLLRDEELAPEFLGDEPPPDTATA